MTFSSMDQTGSKRIERFEHTVAIHPLSCKSKKGYSRNRSHTASYSCQPDSVSLRFENRQWAFEYSHHQPLSNFQDSYSHPRISFPFSFALLDSKRLPSFSFRLFPPTFGHVPWETSRTMELRTRKRIVTPNTPSRYLDISSSERRTLRTYPKFEHDP